MKNNKLIKRKIIKIDNDKCNGCGICANVCHEGAIKIIDNKAVLLRDDYCDGLGDCLPVCPVSAITFEEREALEYNEFEVKKNINKNFEINQYENNINKYNIKSCISSWPIQIKLVSVNASYFKDCDLLIAADCTAFAYGNFHNNFMNNRITLIGCPKLDSIDYSEKISEILKLNNINSITIVRMEVPCCFGIENAVKKAIVNCGKNIDFNVNVVSTNGELLK